MITASEARCRTENKLAIEEFERIIEIDVNLAIGQGDYQVSIVVPKKITDEALNMLIGHLKELDYEISVFSYNGSDRGITLVWEDKKRSKHPELNVVETANHLQTGFA